MSLYMGFIMWVLFGALLQALVLHEKGMGDVMPTDREEAVGTVVAMIFISFIWPVIVPEALDVLGIKLKRIFS